MGIHTSFGIWTSTGVCFSKSLNIIICDQALHLDKCLSVIIMQKVQIEINELSFSNLQSKT